MVATNKREAIRQAVEKTLGDPASSEDKKKLEQALIEIFEKEKTAREALGFSEEFVRDVYEKGYNWFRSGNISLAKKAFEFLRMLNDQEIAYPAALAACAHALKEWQEAIYYYSLVSYLAPEDPLPYYRIGECLLQQKNELLADVFFKLALARAEAHENSSQYEALKQRCLLLRSNLNKN